MLLLRCLLAASVVTVVANHAQAATYYVSAAGSDSNAGTSESAAWQTIAKVNAANLAAGDQVLFRRGDTFHGTLTPHNSGTSGSAIRFDAYGSGDAPRISALAVLSGWTSIGGNLYEATLPVDRDALMVVVIGGEIQQIGRYPRATDANAGYLTFEGHSGATSLSDVDLASVPNFVGAQIVVRINHWVLDRGVVTAQTASSVNFTAPVNTASYEFENGYGYFFQNHVATLTAQGDWAFDATRNVVTMYSAASPAGVSASVLDSALVMTSQHDVTFQNLVFEGGSTRTVSMNSVSNVTVADCEVAFSGTHGIYFAASSNVLLERNYVHDSLNNGVWFYGGSATGLTARYNLIEDTGLRAGMGEATIAMTHTGFVVHVGHDATIEYNTVRNTGYTGISFDGDDILVKNNVVDRFCSVKDDGGGIYSWHGTLPLTLNSGRQVVGNIVFNGITAPAGTAEGIAGGSASGIYMDLYASGVEITNNTVYAVPFGRGIILNNSRNVAIRGNTLYGAETGIAITHWLLAGAPVSDGLDIRDNVIFPTDADRRILRYFDWGLDQPAPATLLQRVQGLGSIDGNYYGSFSPTPFWTPHYPVSTGPAVLPDMLTLDGWRAFSGFDAESQWIAARPSYTINSELPTNLVGNGTFDTSVSGVGSYSSNSAHTVSHETTSPLTGAGSLRLDVSMSTPRIRTTLLFNLGAVDATKRYVVRFSTRGTSANGQVDVYIRRTASPYDTISGTVTRTFREERVDHELLLEHPATVVGGTLAIAFPESIGTVYLDNVEVHEVDATTRDPLETVYFVANATDSTVTRLFEGTAVDARGATHTGSIVLGAYSSAILIGDTVSEGHDIIDGGMSDAGFPVLDLGVLADGSVLSDGGLPGFDAGSMPFADGGVGGPGDIALRSNCSCDIASSKGGTTPFAIMIAMLASVVVARRMRRTR